MILTVIAALVVIAFVLVILAGIGKCSLWVPVLLLSIVELLRILPLGK